MAKSSDKLPDDKLPFKLSQIQKNFYEEIQKYMPEKGGWTEDEIKRVAFSQGKQMNPYMVGRREYTPPDVEVTQKMVPVGGREHPVRIYRKRGTNTLSLDGETWFPEGALMPDDYVMNALVKQGWSPGLTRQYLHETRTIGVYGQEENNTKTPAESWAEDWAKEHEKDKGRL